MEQEKPQSLTKLPVTSFLQQESVKNKFIEVLGDQKGKSFITSVLTLVNQTEQLKNCTPESIYMAAMLSATLDLPIAASLGFAYIVPYGKNATFMCSYKGFIQLAQRTGKFKNISATPIYTGQLKSENPLLGFEFDFTVKADLNSIPIGYAAYFSLINGFEKTYYMSREEVAAHGKKFSKTYNSGPWKTDFDVMAKKTVLKLLLGKFAPLSIEMENAIIADQGVIRNIETMEVDYEDNDQPSIKQQGRQDKATNALKGAAMNIRASVEAKDNEQGTEAWGSFRYITTITAEIANMDGDNILVTEGEVFDPSSIKEVFNWNSSSFLERELINNKARKEKI